MLTRYSIIQYVPDPLAGERINIGILAIGGERMVSRFVPNWDRIDCFAAGRSTEFLRDFARQFLVADPDQLGLSAKFAAAEGITAKDLESIAARWRHSIQFTAPASSTRSPEEVLERIGPKVLRTAAQRPLPAKVSRGRREAQRLAFGVVQMAAALRPSAEVDVVVHRAAPLAGKVENHRFDAVAMNGSPILGMQGISFERGNATELRSHIDALAYTMIDVRNAHPDLALGVLALRPPEGLAPHAYRQFERAEIVFEAIGADIVTEEDARDWTVGQIETYLEGSEPSPPEILQLTIPGAA